MHFSIQQPSAVFVFFTFLLMMGPVLSLFHNVMHTQKLGVSLQTLAADWKTRKSETSRDLLPLTLKKKSSCTLGEFKLASFQLWPVLFELTGYTEGVKYSLSQSFYPQRNPWDNFQISGPHAKTKPVWKMPITWLVSRKNASLTMRMPPLQTTIKIISAMLMVLPSVVGPGTR